jgi:predicted ATPase
VSLSRLWQRQASGQRAESETARKREGEEAGRPEERPSRPASQPPSARLNDAHEMLAKVYNWFTEGFDTVDLKEAKALLDSLESGVKTSPASEVRGPKSPNPKA